MGGGKWQHAQEAALGAIGRLSPQDRIALVTFDDHIDVPLELTAATASARQSAAAALATIEPSWRRGDVRKEYIAIVRGRPSSQRIEIPLVGRRPHQRGKGLVEEACTEIHSVSTTTTGPALTLVVAEIFSGRTHQIRRHLKAIGHPIVGDPKYGDFALNREVARTHRFDRMFLHAASLAFDHPADGRRITLSASCPPECTHLLDQL
jgi:23S rRNA pseudouridine955/2504/2580 synthase